MKMRESFEKFWSEYGDQTQSKAYAWAIWQAAFTAGAKSKEAPCS